MAIRVALHHKTRYVYDRAVELTPQVVRLRPAPHCRTPIPSYSLTVKPEPHFLNWQQDPYSNYLARLVFPAATRVFEVTVDLVAEMTVINPFDFFIEESAEGYPFDYEPALARELTPYLEVEPAPGPRLLAFVESIRRNEPRTVDYIVEINRRLSQMIGYVIRMEPGIQTCDDTLKQATGSCRDTSWLLVQVLRHLGLAARFVSGYLIQLRPDVLALDGPSGASTDFTDLHAWAEVYLPGAGWVGLDPTSGLLAGEGHIPLAAAADPLSAAPISGSFTWTKDPSRGADDRCVPDFHFEMSVTRIHEDPRVTRPYTPAQWAEIDALGHRIDERLRAGDVRLTMGGEPTFVSSDNMDAPEWNTAALGPTKRVLAGKLLTRLRDRYASGAFLHHGQGKWYPGEPLPRWAFSCYWRRDGVPAWDDPALFADEICDYGHGPDEAAAFAHALADRLGVAPAHCIPGYEDAWYYLWRERRLPANVDPLKNNLDDAEDRRRLSQIFEQGLGTVVGYALPLKPAGTTEGGRTQWVSGPWFLRREHLFLTPGDSPMGYRLPLDSLPWTAPADREAFYDLDPFAPRGPLPTAEERAYRFQPRPGSGPGAGASSLAPGAGLEIKAGASAEGIVRTALCVEAREGRLHVFLPPIRQIDDFLDLIAHIEATARALKTPLWLEGYPPPHDDRINHFSVTPDPGVIEVNLHPAHSWPELVEQTSALYDEARKTRLAAEKFMVDGRHTGTGGGNHVVLGGPSPAESPILRRPDLLRSLVGYWHNHPSLSYLFSGMFVGPTSQAPRIDEARNDSLYEMEIAFRQIPDRGGSGTQGGYPPWLVDRVFRNLLIDVTGNTHRAEFCIDKLYSPDSSSGRRGLLEMRALEMPPHPQMSLVQQLLIRAFVARFWDAPYDAGLIRWGTELHDRFMLPHFLAQDFGDVLADLRRSGLALKDEWFAPHFEFRFPPLGEMTQRDVVVELRQAIEPWHVMGEEATGGGTARYVDSSVERLQVKVRGMIGGRHVVACNGRRLPLHPTGTNGEFVAGVRYRAWQPPSALHPTIPVHAPLVFDLVDNAMGRSVGGCTYYVSHPGGRSHDNVPVNAYEAEGRRASRFTPFGHTPGPMLAPTEERNPEAPLTLDLRRTFRTPRLGS